MLGQPAELLSIVDLFLVRLIIGSSCRILKWQAIVHADVPPIILLFCQSLSHSYGAGGSPVSAACIQSAMVSKHTSPGLACMSVDLWRLLCIASIRRCRFEECVPSGP